MFWTLRRRFLSWLKITKTCPKSKRLMVSKIRWRVSTWKKLWWSSREWRSHNEDYAVWTTGFSLSAFRICLRRLEKTSGEKIWTQILAEMSKLPSRHGRTPPGQSAVPVVFAAIVAGAFLAGALRPSVLVLIQWLKFRRVLFCGGCSRLATRENSLELVGKSACRSLHVLAAIDVKSLVLREPPEVISRSIAALSLVVMPLLASCQTKCRH